MKDFNCWKNEAWHKGRRTGDRGEMIPDDPIPRKDVDKTKMNNGKL